ncbi:transposase-like zinc-binding domain-containing protein, partial [Corynebacterium aurimucosum]|uniref:transposase-like zinc-binding domain-containing protein n=1 Tax=Corynebacterium aurimucosum TaxID=169292 RepID=UPI003BB9A403
MTTNRPSCPLCGNNTKKNGTTSKSTTRWRCTHCGHGPGPRKVDTSGVSYAA